MPLREWGCEVLRECEPIAQALDAAQNGAHGGSNAHRNALAAAVLALEDAKVPPSARMLEEMRVRHQDSYTTFVLERSLEHKRALLAKPLSAEADARFARAAEASLGSGKRNRRQAFLRGLAAAVPEARGAAPLVLRREARCAARARPYAMPSTMRMSRVTAPPASGLSAAW